MIHRMNRDRKWLMCRADLNHSDTSKTDSPTNTFNRVLSRAESEAEQFHHIAAFVYLNRLKFALLAAVGEDVAGIDERRAEITAKQRGAHTSIATAVSSDQHLPLTGRKCSAEAPIESCDTQNKVRNAESSSKCDFECWTIKKSECNHNKFRRKRAGAQRKTIRQKQKQRETEDAQSCEAERNAQMILCLFAR